MLWLRWRLCVCLYYHILKTIVTREGTGAYLGAVNKGAVKNGGWWRVVAVTFGLGTKRKKIQKNKVWFFGVISVSDLWGRGFLGGYFWGVISRVISGVIAVGDICGVISEGWFQGWFLRVISEGWFLGGDFWGVTSEGWLLRVISEGDFCGCDIWGVTSGGDFCGWYLWVILRVISVRCEFWGDFCGVITRVISEGEGEVLDMDEVCDNLLILSLSD